jgi:hypothetical protein
MQFKLPFDFALAVTGRAFFFIVRIALSLDLDTAFAFTPFAAFHFQSPLVFADCVGSQPDILWPTPKDFSVACYFYEHCVGPSPRCVTTIPPMPINCAIQDSTTARQISVDFIFSFLI